MTREQRERLKELQEQETLDAAETEELEKLESLLPPDADQDDFDDAWDNDNFTGDSNVNDDNQDDDSDGSDNSDGTDDQDDLDGTDDEPLLPSTPDSQSDHSANADDAGDDSDLENLTAEEKIAKLEAALAKANQAASTWKGRLQVEQEKNKGKKEPSAADTGQGTSDDTTSLEDDAELSEFFEEYPDLKKPILDSAKKVAEKIVESKLKDVRETVTSVQATVQEQNNAKHKKAIVEAHPDWETIYNSGALNTWIEEQPSFMKSRLYEIIQKGTTAEVIEMFDSYKKTVTTKKSDADSLKKKQKIAAMEAVPASSAGPKKKSTKPEKDDFDSSWDYFNREDAK